MKAHRDGDRLLQFLIFNEEFLVSASHQLALITSLPFVHTARRSYRLNDPVRPPDCDNLDGSPSEMLREAVQTLSFRGRRSRNKVSVGEPAEGSFARIFPISSFCMVPAFFVSYHWSCRFGGCLPAYLTISNGADSFCFFFVSYNGGCLGSRIYEERSEVRYAP